MTRDPDIQRIFEIADDSLQGVLGYHFYTIALSKSANSEIILNNLPRMLFLNYDTSVGFVDAFPHTFSWNRFYRKEDLIDSFSPPLFDYYQSRITLTSMTSIFDDLLSNLISTLLSKNKKIALHGKTLPKNPKYWQKIEWAYFESTKCVVGDQAAIARLPKTFGIIDEARRLRNLIMHNHGMFDDMYESDAIPSLERFTHPDYVKYKETGKDTPIIISNEDIINLSKAHIEVLHIIHNHIQNEYFRHLESYSYKTERKNIEWSAAFWGNANMNFSKSSTEKSYLDILLN